MRTAMVRERESLRRCETIGMKETGVLICVIRVIRIIRGLVAADDTDRADYADKHWGHTRRGVTQAI